MTDGGGDRRPGRHQSGGVFDRRPTLFTLAGNPLRLQMLMILAREPLNSAELDAALAGHEMRMCGTHLGHLCRANALHARRTSLGHVYSLTEAGVMLVDGVRAAIGLKGPGPEDLLPGVLGPLSGRFRAFAHPVRLRLLYSMGEGREANLESLIEAMQLPRALLKHQLSVLVEAGMVEVLGTEPGSDYRLSQPAHDLRRALAPLEACVDIHVMKKDLQRLAAMAAREAGGLQERRSPIANLSAPRPLAADGEPAETRHAVPNGGESVNPGRRRPGPAVARGQTADRPRSRSASRPWSGEP